MISEIILTGLKAASTPKNPQNDLATAMAFLEQVKTGEKKTIDVEANDNSDFEEEMANCGPALVPFTEYARIHGISLATVYAWNRLGKLTSATRKEGGQWFVSPTEQVADRRTKRTLDLLKDGSGRKVVRLKGTDYKSVQVYIQERNLVTRNVRRFIRTYDEAKYYELHNYHEVDWGGMYAMIIDINPDYFSNTEGKTNRQLINDGGSPVVPGSEEYKFHLHHIGQKKDSPLAIIPEYDHNDEKLYSVFHSGKATKENLHDKEFEKRKREFWKTYLKYYDEYGSFRQIPFLNSKHKRKLK